MSSTHDQIELGKVLYEQLIKLLDEELLEYGLLILKQPENTNFDETKLLDESFSSQSTSPFLLKEKRLGVAFWSIPIFYSFAFQKFRNKNYKSTKEILDLTKVLLMINTENHTAWNIRREKFNEINFEREIQFLNLLATKSPKSDQIWSYRKWFIKKNKEKLTEKFLTSETKIAEKYSILYPRNYYSWSYRTFILMNFHSLNLIKNEILELKIYTRKNPSDHSGFHYLSTLIEILHEFYKNFDIHDILLDLFFHCQLLIIYFPGHPSIWLFRRFLFQFSFKNAIGFKSENKVKENEEYKDDYYDYNLPSIENEILLVNSCSEDDQIDKFEEQKEYAITYGVYIIEIEEKLHGSTSKNLTPETLEFQYKGSQ
eukprot:gene8224-49_t